MAVARDLEEGRVMGLDERGDGGSPHREGRDNGSELRWAAWRREDGGGSGFGGAASSVSCSLSPFERNWMNLATNHELRVMDKLRHRHEERSDARAIARRRRGVDGEPARAVLPRRAHHGYPCLVVNLLWLALVKALLAMACRCVRRQWASCDTRNACVIWTLVSACRAHGPCREVFQRPSLTRLRARTGAARHQRGRPARRRRGGSTQRRRGRDGREGTKGREGVIWVFSKKFDGSY
ncbi:hypothetical protein ACP4OV_030673 [Aristida adscensionis]